MLGPTSFSLGSGCTRACVKQEENSDHFSDRDRSTSSLRLERKLCVPPHGDSVHLLPGTAPCPMCSCQPEQEPWQARAPAPCSWVLAEGRLGREHLSPGRCPQGHRLPFDPHPSHPALPRRSRGSQRDSLLHTEEGSAATSSCWATSSSSLGKSYCREAKRGEEALAHAESEGAFGGV